MKKHTRQPEVVVKQRRVRREAPPLSKRQFIAQSVPLGPVPVADTRIPMMGERKRKLRRMKLLPTPLTAD